MTRSRLVLVGLLGCGASGPAAQVAPPRPAPAAGAAAAPPAARHDVAATDDREPALVAAPGTALRLTYTALLSSTPNFDDYPDATQRLIDGGVPAERHAELRRAADEAAWPAPLRDLDWRLDHPEALEGLALWKIANLDAETVVAVARAAEHQAGAIVLAHDIYVVAPARAFGRR